MDLNIISIFYLIIRLSPLLVVSHFTLQSILNSDSKGVIYLAGLALTSIVAICFGKVFSENDDPNVNDIVCKSLGLGDFRNVSLSQVTLSFTYVYLMSIIYKMDKVSYDSTNMPTIILFPIIIIFNAIWIITNSCASFTIISLSAIIGAIGGFLWFLFIKSTGNHDLALFNGISNKAICSKPSKTKFKCTKGSA